VRSFQTACQDFASPPARRCAARGFVMNTFEQRQYGMLLRVRDFGDRYGPLFPASSVAGRNFAAVAAAIKELDAQELTHMAASVSARGHRRERARATLLARLQAVGRTARVLAA